MTVPPPIAVPSRPLEADLARAATGDVGATLACLRALEGHVARLVARGEGSRPVVLPSYGGARCAHNLTPLLALLLRSYEVPVLVHGAPVAGARAGSADVLDQLGIAAARGAADAQSRLDSEGIVYVGLDVLAPALAPYGEDARRIAALIDPFRGEAYRLVGVRRAQDVAAAREVLAETRANALLFVGVDGEPFVDPQRPSRFEHFADGAGCVCADAEGMGAAAARALAAGLDVAATAEWTERALVGEVPVPEPLLSELACCLAGTRR